ncbi:LicD family protein [bacterium]|nr:LicD family protein [bacterium]
MNLTLEEMQEINKVQLKIFKEFVKVCEKLNLQYYMVHGSLLGTIRYQGFFPFDDDIDVAMPRKDYEKLLKDGQPLLPQKYFIQSCKTEKEYPLAFAKIRDSETAFIQPVMKNFNVNKGIYIDIFPLDFFPENTVVQKVLNFKNKVYTTRINLRMAYEERQPFYKRTLRWISVLFCPSWEKAVQKRADLYANIKESSKVISVGGKGKEMGMPVKWFEEGKILKFEDMDVICPIMMEEYMTRIYGDYKTYNPAAKYMKPDGKVEVSASVCSTTKSYKTIKE